MGGGRLLRLRAETSGFNEPAASTKMQEISRLHEQRLLDSK